MVERRPYHALFALMACLGAHSAQAQCALPDAFPDAYALVNARVLDVRTGSISENGWVHVDGEVIVALGDVAENMPPDGVPEIDACGLTLVPGLADMHVHLNEEDLPAYLDAGVTTVRNLWGWPGLPPLIKRMEDRELEGPSVFAISPGLDGPPEYWPYTQLVMTPEQGRASVQLQARNGWTTLKLYQDLSRNTYLAIVDEAQKLGLDYGGHVSRKVGIDLALASGHRFIEHLSGYEVALNPLAQGGAFAWRSIDESLIDGLIRKTVEAGTWNCPTLAIFSIIARNDPVVKANRQRFVRNLFDAGANLLVGTDAGIGRTAPGSSLHDEMQEFVEAGIPVADVLRLTTIEAARFFGAEGRFGEIRTGAQADLLFIEGNPLESLSVLRKPEAVILRGMRIR